MSGARKYRYSKKVYFSIPIRTLVVGRERPFPLFIYFKLNDHLILRLESLEPETEDQLSKLTRGGCMEFWSPKEFYAAYLKYLDPGISQVELNKKILELEMQEEVRSADPAQAETQGAKPTEGPKLTNEGAAAAAAILDPNLSEEEKRSRALDAAREMLAALFAKQDAALEILEPELRKVAEFTQEILSFANKERPRVAEDLDRLTRSTLGHSARVAAISSLLALISELTDPEQLADLAFAAMIHDLGKVRLDPRVISTFEAARDEMDEAAYRLHVKETVDLLSDLGISASDRAREVVLCHHEQWSGKGYPRGLSGESIAIEARVLTLADFIDECLSGERDGTSRSLRDAMQIVTQIQSREERFDPVLIARLVREIELAEAPGAEASQVTQNEATG